MTDGPSLDPNWVRRRQQSGPDVSMRIALVVTVLLVGAGAFWLKDFIDRSAAADQMRAVSDALKMEQQQRALAQKRAEEIARQSALWLDAERRRNADARANGIGSSIGERTIHRCGYAGTDVVQLEPCAAPWEEIPGQPVSSHAIRVDEQEQMRAAAEAKLRNAQAQLAAATGLESRPPTWLQGNATAMQTARARCNDAKARRDEAYRVVGNNRSFQFIRSWDGIVYEACKET